jgi:glycosyltransferase involved in cell wall biosynthesis
VSVMHVSPGEAPEVSIVIPVYNEEAILHAAVVDLREQLGRHALTYEIVLAENGSTDRTVAIAAELHRRYPEVRYLSAGEPNYGKALRAGILDARGELVICDEIDLCDVDFSLKARALLRGGADLVVGSKLIQGADDARPWLRHAASVVYTALLRGLLGFPGTDTHGPKAFRRARLLPIVSACVVDRDVFASELVIRAYRSGLSVREIPIRVLEKRPPSINLLRRVPNVVKNLYRLTRAVHRRS